MRGCERRWPRSGSPVAPPFGMVGVLAWPTMSVGTSGYAPVAPVAFVVSVGAPQIWTTAGPPVMNSLLPSMFAGIGGAVRFWRVAVWRVVSARKGNVAYDRLSTPERG